MLLLKLDCGNDMKPSRVDLAHCVRTDGELPNRASVVKIVCFHICDAHYSIAARKGKVGGVENRKR
jgi:hypothetical protein